MAVGEPGVRRGEVAGFVAVPLGEDPHLIGFGKHPAGQRDCGRKIKTLLL